MGQRGFYCQDSLLTKAAVSIRQDASIMTPCQTLQESEKDAKCAEDVTFP